MTHRILAISPMVVFPVAIVIASAPALDIQMSRWTVDAGGTTDSTGGSFELSGTMGQADAGVMTGGDFELTGGFWFRLPHNDCNSDGWVDLIDYDDFDGCLSGPSGGVAAPRCNCFDLDSDNDVDLADTARFQIAFTGG